MKNYVLVSLFVVSATFGASSTAHSFMGSKIGSKMIEPKMIVTCNGVSGSLNLSAKEAKQFIKNVKNLKADNPICLKNQETKAFCLGLINSNTKKCSTKVGL